LVSPPLPLEKKAFLVGGGGSLELTPANYQEEEKTPLWSEAELNMGKRTLEREVLGAASKGVTDF
jgi:hypothetical protein